MVSSGCLFFFPMDQGFVVFCTPLDNSGEDLLSVIVNFEQRCYRTPLLFFIPCLNDVVRNHDISSDSLCNTCVHD